MHRIDRYILTQLLTHNIARFSELKPEGVESNAFTYRLKRLEHEGVVGKNDVGHYYLTAEGRYYTDRLNLGKFTQRKIPKSICLMVVRQKPNTWLLVKRNIHPLRELIGLPMSHVKVGESIIETAKHTLSHDLGIKTKLTYRGGGYLTFYRGKELESYVQFNLLENTTPPTGELKTEPNGELETCFWQTNPDFKQPEYLPSLRVFESYLKKNKLFFTELQYKL